MTANMLKNYTIDGTISALNGTVELDCPGSASAVIQVNGTFNGILEVTGSGDPVSANGIQGGRLVFKSGVGSIGENLIRNNGEALATEYRIVTGGKSVRVKAISWTSGTVAVQITSSPHPSAIFINGPIHNAFEEAVRAGRAFSAGTGAQELSTQTLNMTFQNPADSNVNCFVTLRRFSNDRANTSNMLQAGLVLSFSDITGGTVVTPNNLKTGGTTSVVDFTYKIDSAPIGTAVLETPLALNGIPTSIDVVRLVQPGEEFAYQIEGLGGGNNTSTVAFAAVWYEETVN